MNPHRDPQDPPLDALAVTELLRAIADAGWDEASLTAEGTTLLYSRSSSSPGLTAAAGSRAVEGTDVAPPATLPGPPVEAAAAPAGSATGTGSSTVVPDDGHTVTAPSLGLFWRSPQPGAPPFVEVGDEIEEGATVCIVEVMKLMNHVKADVAGKVVAIHQENGQMVEYGSPLVTLEPS